MELRIAPTSPKKHIDRQQSVLQSGAEKQQPPKKVKGTFGVYIFAAVIGIIAGASAALFIFIQSDWFGFLTNSAPVTRTTNDISRSSSQNEALVQSLEITVSQSILMVFHSSPANEKNNFQAPTYVGEAVFLTSDGIAMTTLSTLSQEGSFVAVDANGKTQTITDIYRDSVSGLAFFRFSGNGYSAVQLKKQDTTFPKSSLYVFWQENRYDTFAYTLAQMHHVLGDTAHAVSSEDFFSDVSLVQQGLQIPQGALLFSGDGSLYGFFMGSANDPSVVYLPDRKSQIDMYLSSKKLTYSYLGVYGFDLSLTLSEFHATSLGFSKGFLLASDALSKKAAVTPKSPAAKASLLEGDIIMKVGATSLDAAHSLSSVLLGATGTVQLTVQRGTKEFDVQVDLQPLPQ